MAKVVAIDRTLSASEWGRQIQHAHGEWLFVSALEAEFEAVQKACAGFDPSTVYVLPESMADDTALLDRLPPWLRVIVVSSRWDGLLVHRDIAQRTAATVKGPDTAGEWLFNVVLSGGAVQVVDAAAIDRGSATHRSPTLPPLAPAGPSRPWLKSLLSKLEPEKFAGGVRSSVDVKALKAGILQVHDFLDESHQLSQSIEGAGKHRHGDYWHAIMHRRERDYSNSKYWFRHVGRHPIYAELAEIHAAQVERIDDVELTSRLSQLVDGRGEWDPFAFVDFCRVCEDSGHSAGIAAAERLQWAEMLLLLKATVDDALFIK